jgi:spore germination protein GerM
MKKVTLIFLTLIEVFIIFIGLFFLCELKNRNAAEVLVVKAYFSNTSMDPEISCNKVFAVNRQVPKTQAVARAAIEELLKGPTDTEKNSGFFTSINSGVKINSLSIDNGTAKIDFDDSIEKGAGGSCKVSAIRAEITQTLKQFPTVKEVIISVNGRTEDILQP